MGFPLKIFLPNSFKESPLKFGNVFCSPTFETNVIFPWKFDQKL
jgi:hypothetical protein